MREYLKWWLCKKELQELEAWRINWQQYRQWLSEFKIISETLDNMKAEVYGESRSACYPPVENGPLVLSAFREYLRKKYKGE